MIFYIKRGKERTELESDSFLKKKKRSERKVGEEGGEA